MTLDRAVMIFAGCVVLLGVALSLTVHPWWIALTAFAGLNMIQASFTGFCPAASVFRALGIRPGTAFK
ncbi:YgaP family membrane protein [Sphingobium ummariense]